MTVATLAPHAQRLAELVDLKRVRVAGRDGSLAEHGFVRAWSALVAGEEAGAVARAEAARALLELRLPGVDAHLLRAGGLDEEQADAVLRRALADSPFTPPRALAQATQLPSFVVALREQPRAGATAPGRPRLVLTPQESHAEHCWVVAVGAALGALDDGVEPAEPFLCGLAHHLHNAELPDAGFAGETLLGEHLDTVVTTLRERALAQLDEPLRSHARDACALALHVDTPAARAFVTADVLDRVLELRVHERQAAFTLDQALDELDLVHEGPLQAFGLAVVEEAGLR